MRHGLTALKEREVAAGNVAQYPEPWWEQIHVAQVLQEGKGVGGYALLTAQWGTDWSGKCDSGTYCSVPRVRK